MQLGGLQDNSQVCSMATVQKRAARIDQICCPVGADCAAGFPSACSFDCAMYFVPFYEDCSVLLAALGSDMSSFSTQCSSVDIGVAEQVIATAQCDPILSCHNPTGPLYCIDATEGGGATRDQLQVCGQWASQGGGWMPSVNPCTAIGNLITNGGFDADDISNFMCNNEVYGTAQMNTACGYKYVYPDSLQRYCNSGDAQEDCALSGWQKGSQIGESTVPAQILLKENNECSSADTRIGEFPGDPSAGLDQCTSLCKQTADCKFFLYSTDASSGSCWVEHTTGGDCPEGWRENSYNFCASQSVFS